MRHTQSLETRRYLPTSQKCGVETLAYTVVLGKSARRHHVSFEDPVAVFVAVRGAPSVLAREKAVKIAAKTLQEHVRNTREREGGGRSAPRPCLPCLIPIHVRKRLIIESLPRSQLKQRTASSLVSPTWRRQETRVMLSPVGFQWMASSPPSPKNRRRHSSSTIYLSDGGKVEIISNTTREYGRCSTTRGLPPGSTRLTMW